MSVSEKVTSGFIISVIFEMYSNEVAMNSYGIQDMSKNARLVLPGIFKYHNSNKGKALASAPMLSLLLNMSERSVKYAIKELREYRLISVRSGRSSMANVYQASGALEAEIECSLSQRNRRRGKARKSNEDTANVNYPF